MGQVKQQLQQCLENFRAGTLREEDLQGALDSLERPGTQSILYIQAPTTSPHDIAIGMSIFEEGKDPEGVDENGKFLYETINEALEDGWRIVKFPEVALVLDEQTTYGIGYEFVLERWR